MNWTVNQTVATVPCEENPIPHLAYNVNIVCNTLEAMPYFRMPVILSIGEWTIVASIEMELKKGQVHICRTIFYDTPMYSGQPSRKEILELLPAFECIAIYEGYNMLQRNKIL